MPNSLARTSRLRRWLAPYLTPDVVPASARQRATLFPFFVHIFSLVLIGVVYVVLTRGQWFFYDEWTFLDPANTWAILAPHNGHLSLALVVITSVIKSVVGLHAYWPYLAVTIAIHLVIVHLVWRAMNRARVLPSITLLGSLVFGLLAVGAENTLWAFQTGFIAPIAFGMVAYELIDRQHPCTRRVVIAAVLLGVAILFSSTALPFFAVGVLLLLVRRGWLTALVVALAIGIPYLVWRVLFVRGSQPTDSFAAHSIGDYLARVPTFLVTSLVNSLASVGPGPALAAAVLVAFTIWSATDIKGRKAREIPVAYYLLLVGLVFAILVAVSRLRLGEDGSAGRYVYLYVAVSAPAFGMALTWLVHNSRVAMAGAAVGLAVMVAFNAVNLSINAKSQASIEQFTEQSVSAAIQLAKAGSLRPTDVPMTVLAPSLTVREIVALADSGKLTQGPFGEAAQLSDLVNVNLKTDPLPGSPPLTDCTPGDQGFHLDPGPQHQVELRSSKPETVGITVVQAGVSSAYTQLQLHPGVQQLIGFDDATIVVNEPTNGSVCIPQFVG